MEYFKTSYKDIKSGRVLAQMLDVFSAEITEMENIVNDIVAGEIPTCKLRKQFNAAAVRAEVSDRRIAGFVKVYQAYQSVQELSYKWQCMRNGAYSDIQYFLD